MEDKTHIRQIKRKCSNIVHYYQIYADIFYLFFLYIVVA